jgi:uncharacterized protein (DUF1330 family)
MCRAHFASTFDTSSLAAPSLKPAQRSQQPHQEVCCAHSADSKKNSESHLFKHSSPAPQRIQAAQTQTGGRNFRTGGGKVVGLDGPPPPKRVAITEWDNLEKAEAFFKSKAWTDLGPDRDKAIKTIRRYAVEAVN